MRKGGEFRACILELEYGCRELTQIVGTLRSSPGLAGLLDRGEKEPDERGDDRDDNEQFDEREAVTTTRRKAHGHPRTKSIPRGHRSGDRTPLPPDNI